MSTNNGAGRIQADAAPGMVDSDASERARAADASASARAAVAAEEERLKTEFEKGSTASSAQEQRVEDARRERDAAEAFEAALDEGRL